MSWLFFSPSGRIGRQLYALAWLYWLCLNGFLVARIFANQEVEIALASWTLALVACGLISTVSSIFLTIKRLHDIGQPGLFALGLFIPVVSPLLFLTLCFWPGMPEPNAFGGRRDGPSGP